MADNGELNYLHALQQVSSSELTESDDKTGDQHGTGNNFTGDNIHKGDNHPSQSGISDYYHRTQSDSSSGSGHRDMAYVDVNGTGAGDDLRQSRPSSDPQRSQDVRYSGKTLGEGDWEGNASRNRYMDVSFGVSQACDQMALSHNNHARVNHDNHPVEGHSSVSHSGDIHDEVNQRNLTLCGRAQMSEANYYNDGSKIGVSPRATEQQDLRYQVQETKEAQKMQSVISAKSKTIKQAADSQHGERLNVEETEKSGTSKIHRCDYCKAMFLQKHHLTQHVKTHTGQKPHRCDICSAAFTQKHSLNRHQRVHTGVKPYTCSQCSAVFALKHGLVQHLVIHTGEKNYKCDRCLMKFTRKFSLERHLKVHDKKPEETSSP